MDDIKVDVILHVYGKDEDGVHDDCFLSIELDLPFMPLPGLVLKFQRKAEDTNSEHTIFLENFLVKIGRECIDYDLASRTLSIRRAMSFDTSDKYIQAIKELTEEFGFKGDGIRGRRIVK